MRHSLGKIGHGVRVAQLQVLSRGLVQLGHDMQNHLATINESAGLMIDLLQLKRKKRFDWAVRFFKRPQGVVLDVEPFVNDLNLIQEEVMEGATLTQRLSRFARHLEETDAVFGAHEALEEIREALLRQAEGKGIRLEIKLAKTGPMIDTDRPGFQVAVLCLLEQVVGVLESGQKVLLETDIREGAFQVRVTSPRGEEPPRLPTDEPGNRHCCRDIVEDLGGQVLDRSGDGSYVMTLAFPLADGGA